MKAYFIFTKRMLWSFSCDFFQIDISSYPNSSSDMLILGPLSIPCIVCVVHPIFASVYMIIQHFFKFHVISDFS